MSRQDKATTDRNSRTLRELVKRPENKVCADCKRNGTSYTSPARFLFDSCPALTDPRWASWNLSVMPSTCVTIQFNAKSLCSGVFVCIRCSGIHRSMGTHISKVKSVDLDVWTPEQMRVSLGFINVSYCTRLMPSCASQSVQQWGNVRANLYWEAHLKAGHIPADHKMDSFIRSKYESRRWAMEGPPPEDPATLESGVEREPSPVSQPTCSLPITNAH